LKGKFTPRKNYSTTSYLKKDYKRERYLSRYEGQEGWRKGKPKRKGGRKIKI